MDGSRTRYIQILNLVLCQMSYHSISPVVQNPCSEHTAVIIMLMNRSAPLVRREWCFQFGSPEGQSTVRVWTLLSRLPLTNPEVSRRGAMTREHISKPTDGESPIDLS